jgi:hypothetical protein
MFWYSFGVYLIAMFLCMGYAMRLGNPRDAMQGVLVLYFGPFIVAMYHWRITLALAAILLATLTLTGCDEYEQAVMESASYCEAVDTYKQTGGVYGHPAYRGERECKALDL